MTGRVGEPRLAWSAPDPNGAESEHRDEHVSWEEIRRTADEAAERSRHEAARQAQEERAHLSATRATRIAEVGATLDDIAAALTDVARVAPSAAWPNGELFVWYIPSRSSSNIGTAFCMARPFRVSSKRPLRATKILLSVDLGPSRERLSLQEVADRYVADATAPKGMPDWTTFAAATLQACEVLYTRYR